MVDPVLYVLAFNEDRTELTCLELLEVVVPFGPAADDSGLADGSAFVINEFPGFSEFLHVGTCGGVFAAVGDVFGMFGRALMKWRVGPMSDETKAF